MTEDTTVTGDSVVYDSEADQFRARFDPPPSLAIVELVATIAGEDPVDLDPLAETIDPDSLNQLFSLSTSPQREGDIHLQFHYHGYDIFVHSYGVLTAEPTAVEEAGQDNG